MSINVQCGQCSKRYAAPDKLAGQRVMCPECGAAVNVPAAAAGPERSGCGRHTFCSTWTGRLQAPTEWHCNADN